MEEILIDDIRKSEKGGNTAYLNVGAWYNAETGHIHLTLPHSDWFHTTVSPAPDSKRGHPNLYGKLAKALKQAGVPAPEVLESKGPRGEKRQQEVIVAHHWEKAKATS